MEGKIMFIDPATGDYYLVAPRRTAIEVAELLGYMPASSEDEDARNDAMEPPE